MVNCVFCQIVSKKIKSLRIYEDESTLCLLDTHPISRGHSLIIPKKHFKNIFDVEENYLKQLIVSTQKVSKLLKKKLNADGVNVLHASGKFAQQSVFHFHIHVVPRYKKDKLDTWPKSNYKEQSLENIYKTIQK